jgi:uncharacterized DUF497 family protein
MKINYSYRGIRFEWDSQKASENLKKHGIPFETACEALLDPFVRMADDEGERGEVRENAIGLTTAWQLLYVVFNVRRDDIFRIISARIVTKAERKFYEEW